MAEVMMAVKVNFFIFVVFMIKCSQAYYPYEDISKVLEEYPLPKLNYDYDAFKPYIDVRTMQVHHSGHHAAYTQKMNSALKEWRASAENIALSSKSILEIMKSLEKVPERYKTALKNNGGGYLNHAIYFSLLSPNPKGIERQPVGTILKLIERSFGNFSLFKDMFTKSALSLFGSGYVWLCYERRNHVLTYFPTVNQESPLSYGLEPILVIDVWEHAYYLKHQNKRSNYIADWWKVVDWETVSHLYEFWNKLVVHEEL